MKDHDNSGDYLNYINTSGIGNAADMAKERTRGIEIIEGRFGTPAVISINRKESTLVGSAGYCNVVIDDRLVPQNNGQTTINREQSRIFVESNLFYIENLGSEVGTRLGGLLVNSPRVLVQGAKVSFKNEDFLIYDQGEIVNGEITRPLILARRSVINEVGALMEAKPAGDPESKPENVVRKMKTITTTVAAVDPAAITEWHMLPKKEREAFPHLNPNTRTVEIEVPDDSDSEA